MWIELNYRLNHTFLVSVHKKKKKDGEEETLNSSSAKHLCSNAALLIHCNTCSADNGMQGENNRGLYYSKSPFGIEVAWDLGAQSRKEAFLLYYTLLKEIGRIWLCSRLKRSMQSNKTDYENSLIFSWTEPLKSLILGKQHYCISALRTANRVVS